MQTHAEKYPVQRLWIETPPERSALDTGFWFPKSPYVYLYSLVYRLEEQRAWAQPTLLERWMAPTGYGAARRAESRARIRELIARARPLQRGEFEGYMELVMEEFKERRRWSPEARGVDETTIRAMAEAVFRDPPELHHPGGAAYVRALREGVMPPRVLSADDDGAA